MSKLDFYVDILNVLDQNGPLKLSHTMFKSNVNCSVLRQFLDSLLQQSLIEEQTFQKEKQQKIVYALTERGKSALKCYREITLNLPLYEDVKRPYVLM